MNDFLPRRGEKGRANVRPSKMAAIHTAQNLTSPHKNEVVTSQGHLQAVKPEPPKRSFKQWLKSRTKKQWIIFSVIAVLVLGGIGVGLYVWLKPAPQVPVAKPKPKEEPKPEPVIYYSNLTGLPVDQSVNDRPVTGIMIENSVDARPQSGLNQAGVVFEAIAEGGITRFLTLFQDTEPDYIGPVRSVRPYYVQWAQSFDAPIAHVGGSPDGLAAVRAAKDLDQFAGGAYFWRIKERPQPHNVYTSIAKLREYENKKGYGKSNFTSLSRKTESPSASPSARTIDLNISSSNYNVHYDYDAGSNSYKRSEGGKSHTDARSGAQLSPKVVIALVLKQGLNGKYTTYETTGSGQVFVFQDGVVSTGTWKRDGNTSQFSFTDGNGAEIKLNPGQTWFTAVGGADRVSFKP